MNQRVSTAGCIAAALSIPALLDLLRFGSMTSEIAILPNIPASLLIPLHSEPIVSWIGFFGMLAVQSLFWFTLLYLWETFHSRYLGIMATSAFISLLPAALFLSPLLQHAQVSVTSGGTTIWYLRFIPIPLLICSAYVGYWSWKLTFIQTVIRDALSAICSGISFGLLLTALWWFRGGL